MSEIPYDEAEAARRLGVSKATLSRERLAGRIHPMRIGQRIIRYTDEILHEYRRRCPDDADAIVEKAMACRTKVVRECGLYLLWSGDEVVYVGQTQNFIARLANHIFRKDFDSYSFLRAEPDRVFQLEAMLIDRLRPRLNVLLNAEARTIRRTGR